jgi:Zn-dependent peptidase ImmA (M78 family)
MNEPITKAKWVLETKGVIDIPALSLGTIADSENIKYQYGDFSDDPWLDGLLLYKGEKRIILVNTHRGNLGKHHFTFAHELGHYFMNHPPSFSQNGQSGFRCTSDDIQKEQKPREIEANRFAAELLMPESRFRLDMAGAPIDFGLIDSLSKQYMVSKHACSNRILGLTQAPCIIIRTSGLEVISFAASRAARGFLRHLSIIPENTAAQTAIIQKRWHDDFTSCPVEKWLARTIPGKDIYECTHIHSESGMAMTILKW